MSSDRELLELAAKADGHGIWFDHATSVYFYEDKFTRLLWNPLDDDGDAMRLAVKLEMLIDAHGLHARACYPYEEATVTIETKGDDPCAATRRAIVRAAAEIGRQMS